MLSNIVLFSIIQGLVLEVFTIIDENIEQQQKLTKSFTTIKKDLKNLSTYKIFMSSVCQNSNMEGMSDINKYDRDNLPRSLQQQLFADFEESQVIAVRESADRVPNNNTQVNELNEYSTMTHKIDLLSPIVSPNSSIANLVEVKSMDEANIDINSYEDENLKVDNLMSRLKASNDMSLQVQNAIGPKFFSSPARVKQTRSNTLAEQSYPSDGFAPMVRFDEKQLVLDDRKSDNLIAHPNPNPDAAELRALNLQFSLSDSKVNANSDDPEIKPSPKSQSRLQSSSRPSSSRFKTSRFVTKKLSLALNEQEFHAIQFAALDETKFYKKKFQRMTRGLHWLSLNSADESRRKGSWKKDAEDQETQTYSQLVDKHRPIKYTGEEPKTEDADIEHKRLTLQNSNLNKDLIVKKALLRSTNAKAIKVGVPISVSSRHY